jgi:Flp pilus assembly protein TadB
MRLVAIVVASFVAGLVLLAREYLAPYGTPVGQLVLVVVFGYWGLGFWWMHRMGRASTVERFLAPSGGTP